MADTALTICEEAAREIGVLGADQGALDPGDAAVFMVKLNRLLDNWNAERRAVYADTFNTYVLTPDLNPHTFGPTGATFTLTQRPVRIDAAGIVDGDTRYALMPRDAAWWAGQTLKTLSSDLPTDFFWDAAWPLGRLFLWPVPSAAKTLELHVRVVLAQLASATAFTMPPGYKDAVVLTLAEETAPIFGKTLHQRTVQSAQAARARAFANNDRPPYLATADCGLVSGRAYDYRKGPLLS